MMLVVTLTSAPNPPRETWFAVRYNPGVMERVSRNRKLPVVDCMLAHPTLKIGAWAWVEGQKTDVRRRCRVTDTSHPRDRARHIRTRRIELDYESSRAICGGWWKGKATECPVSLWSVAHGVPDRRR